VEFIELKVRKFEALVKRKDIKSPQWFAMPIDILEHPDFFDITGDEFKAYVWVMGIATKLNTDVVRIYPALFERRTAIKKKTIELTIEKLNGKRWDVTRPLRVRTDSVRTRTATVQDSTGQDKTGQDSTGIIQGNYVTEGSVLIELWNLHCGTLPKIQALTDKRKKAASVVFTELTENDWISAIQKTAQSKFCCGLTGGTWKASFDWFISKRKKDDVYNFIKCLEGNYDNTQNIKDLVKNEANYRWAMGES
jgi:hypothetical protein